MNTMCINVLAKHINSVVKDLIILLVCTIVIGIIYYFLFERPAHIDSSSFSTNKDKVKVLRQILPFPGDFNTIEKCTFEHYITPSILPIRPTHEIQMIIQVPPSTVNSWITNSIRFYPDQIEDIDEYKIYFKYIRRFSHIYSKPEYYMDSDKSYGWFIIVYRDEGIIYFRVE